MQADSNRAVAVVLAIVAAGAAIGVLAPRFFRLSSNAETDIITVLKATERDGLQLAVPGMSVPLLSQQVHFDRISVTVDFEQGTATAISTLDFRGKMGDVQVSSLGLERTRFKYVDHAWKPEGELAPTLARIVGTLEARRRAIEAGSVGRLQAMWAGEKREELLLSDQMLRAVLQVQPRSYRARAWYIRLERDEVLVTEDFHLSGQLPDRPIDELGSRRLSLRLHGTEFLFWPSLM